MKVGDKTIMPAPPMPAWKRAVCRALGLPMPKDIVGTCVACLGEQASSPALSFEVVGQIAEFLARAAYLDGPDPNQYFAINMLAMRLAMELPAGLYRAVVRAAHGCQQSGTIGPLWSAVDAVRERQGFDADTFSGAETFWSGPGIGNTGARV